MTAADRVLHEWAAPPKNLGEVLADEVYRIAKQRDMVLVLSHEERNQMMRAVKAWEVVSDD